MFPSQADECRIFEAVPPSDPESSPPRSRRIRLDLTLREVDPTEELVYFIEKRAAELEAVVEGRARCALTLQPKRQWDQHLGYEVEIRVVGGQAYAESTYVDADPLLAVRDAFDVVHRRLERTSSGVVLKSGGEDADAEDDAASGEGHSS